MAGMLIRDAEVRGSIARDVRIAGGRVAAMGSLSPDPGETVIDARGGALLPGLHDHHIHLAALAARDASLWCGPPEVMNREALAARLAGHPGTGWIRAVGYHECVMGLPTARELDAIEPSRPLRIQHRSGRLWLFNSRAMAELLEGATAPPGLDQAAGHLFDADEWLRTALGSAPPELDRIAARLASYGVTGVTDMSPRNDRATARHFAGQLGGRLHCLMAGSLALGSGPAKLHLHEAALPSPDDVATFIAAARDQQRPVAVHCVSEVELVFTLACLAEAGVIPGDRIEHASVASPWCVDELARLGLAVCVQPHFIAERGDQYLADVEPGRHADLYRLQSLSRAGIVLAGGSDAPFGLADPWRAMAAAISRRTLAGAEIGGIEALDPDEALALWLADPVDLSRTRRIAPGAPADLCLLDLPWNRAAASPDARHVRMTMVSGVIVHDRVNQPPIERGGRTDPLAR